MSSGASTVQGWLIEGGTLVTPWQRIPGGVVAVEHGRIVYAGPRDGWTGAGEPTSNLRALDASDCYVVPGFIDVHVHGGGGADTMQGTAEALRAMARSHARFGTTGFLATTVAAAADDLVRVARGVAAAGATGGAELLGVHLEGPYINPKRAGAQNPAYARPPDLDELGRLFGILGPRLRLVTLAPELPGAGAAIRWLSERGVTVSLGHTAARWGEAMAGIAAGIRHATHTYNAMQGLHHRDPGALGAVLTDDRVTAELIGDGVHVHPGAMRLLWRAKGPERIALVTDCIHAMGMPEGPSRLGGLPIIVKDGVVRLAADGETLAGSVLTADRAVRNMVEMVGVPLADAVRMASSNPAATLGLEREKGSLEAGKDADLVLLGPDLDVRLTMVGGQVVYAAAGKAPGEGARSA